MLALFGLNESLRTDDVAERDSEDPPPLAVNGEEEELSQLL